MGAELINSNTRNCVTITLILTIEFYIIYQCSDTVFCHDSQQRKHVWFCSAMPSYRSLCFAHKCIHTIKTLIKDYTPSKLNKRFQLPKIFFLKKTTHHKNLYGRLHTIKTFMKDYKKKNFIKTLHTIKTLKSFLHQILWCEWWPGDRFIKTAMFSATLQLPKLKRRLSWSACMVLALLCLQWLQKSRI